MYKENLGVRFVALFSMALFLLTACIENIPPIADAGTNQRVSVGDRVSLDGSKSWDQNDDLLTYRWSLVKKPDMSQAGLSDPFLVAPWFIADVIGQYVVQLQVSDGLNNSAVVQIVVIADFKDNVFEHKGVNGQCVTCHNGTDATGKSAIHIVTTDSCETCHFLTQWAPSTVNHNEVLGPCSNCHVLPTASHVTTKQECSACHTTDFWTAGPGQNNGHGKGANCEDCHNGTNAQGKSAKHLASTDRCNACHSDIAWLPTIRVDHNEVLGICVSCHNGELASGKSANHLQTSDSCEACHTTSVWSPVSSVDHTQATGVCVDCHNGTTTIGKAITHFASSDNCAACHATTAWVPAIVVDHNEVLGTCNGCHGLPVTAPHRDKPGYKSCSTCHTTSAWKPAIKATLF